MAKDGFLERAEGFLRTARSAVENGDWPQAYENARTACELAAKELLARKAVPATGKEHNVTSQLVQAGLWPGGDVGKRLSRFMGDHTRGIYGIVEPVTRAEAERGCRMAEDLINKVRKHGQPPA